MKLENLEKAVETKEKLEAVISKIALLEYKENGKEYLYDELSIYITDCNNNDIHLHDLFDVEEIRQRALAALKTKKAELEKQILEL
ncbi:MAG: hypothetical protein LBU09_03445 [Endomicrobium sp.]|jgi:hypothetical protein|nr:hypothetical protein [Endomicrobium sp.]